MKGEAEGLLAKGLGRERARFREGQWECVEALLANRRLLVVQRTGWGKSMVYFVATKLRRTRNAGLTLLVSPLLSLMRNQIAAAERMGLCALTLNSANRDDWAAIERELFADRVDLLLISPERLANEGFQSNVLPAIAPRIGMLVVDEAHCISDWGHDFRPDYRRIVRVLQGLPPNTPVLATTATANDRVVEDVCRQIGELEVARGPLLRRGLKLQTLQLPSAAVRLAWLAHYLQTLPGSGIIYTLTVSDAERVAEWLQFQGYPVEAYHAGREHDDKVAMEDRLLGNQIKALVATVALGMGFDKPDLGFVVHFQRPGSVVHYYQQVGRAGRAVAESYGILLGGDEDDEITDYFIETAFPPLAHVDAILAALRASDGMTLGELQRAANLSFFEIEKALKLLSLESPSPVAKQGSRWSATAVKYVFDQATVVRLCELRKAEQQEMAEYMRTGECLMQFLSRSLSDPSGPCGFCANCRGTPHVPVEVDPAVVREASRFLKRCHVAIPPRLKWPEGEPLTSFPCKGMITDTLRCEPGKALSLWGDAGWGEDVKRDKYTVGRFSDELVEACAEMIGEWNPDPKPGWVTCVPSHRHPTLVPDFAARLAARLGLPFHAVFEKSKKTSPQKEMQNSYQQVHNLDGAFRLSGPPPVTPALLVDDLVDSRWTMTLLGALLRREGCPAVFPLALAANSLR